MCRGISPIVGGKVTDICVPRCKFRPIKISPRTAEIRKRAIGTTVVAIERVGKRPIVRLDTGHRLVFEPRMTGLLLIADAPDEDHLRFGITLTGASVSSLWFWDRRGLGTVRLLNEAQFRRALGPDQIGPDAMQITAEQLKDRLGPSRRDIKVALLDQKAVAGIGNLYASELLHVAGVNPRKKCHRITRRMWQAMHAAMRDVLEAAIRYEGSTLADGTFRNALNGNGSYQNHHRVYMRAGKRCGKCQEATIKRIVQAQRSTFYCPRCQRR
jgi:formamidopyrimidine-DNA glycosylase